MSDNSGNSDAPDAFRARAGTLQVRASQENLTESEWVALLSQKPVGLASDLTILGLSEADDAACLSWRGSEDADRNLMAISTDSICEGTHFPANAPAWWLAQRIIYAGISDLYSVGAQPLFILMDIVDKSLEKQHYKELLENIDEVANREKLSLIGGNTARGAQRQIHLSAVGQVPSSKVKSRAGAKAGDLIFLTGPTGRYARARADWDWPNMRLPSLSPWLEPLRQTASACIDISDGLIGDVGCLARASGVSAHLWRSHLPVVCAPGSKLEGVDLEKVLYGGEDYVLCFTIPDIYLKNKELERLSPIIIGKMTAGEGVRLYEDRNEEKEIPLSTGAGFDHFGGL